MVSGTARPIGSNTGARHRPAADTAQMHVQHVQGEVVAGTQLLRSTLGLVGRATVGCDADFDFGQRHGSKVRNENDIPERLDSRNRNRPDAFDQ